MFFNIFKSEQPRKPKQKPKASSKNQRAGTKTASRSSNVVKMPVDQVRIGMYVRELDKKWEDSSFMFQGLDVQSNEDIQALRNECQYVWVDSNSTDSTRSGPTQGTFQDKGAPRTTLPIEAVYDGAREANELARQTVQRMFEEIRLGGQIDAGKVTKAVSNTVESILKNPDASIWLTRLQAKDAHTAQHSLNVAALSIVVGRGMGFSTKELEDLGVCAMLHDVGKTSLPTELIAKQGPLTEEEWGLMRKHPKFGRDILVSTRSVFSGAADVAFTHHERSDGKGYPLGLTDEDIPVYSKIVSIAEAYDTITSQQPYRDARSPSEALHILYNERGKQFDDEFVIKFIDCVGIFPPGSIVEMTNGEVGIVLSNTADKLKPKVIILLDRNKDAGQQRVVDLSKLQSDTEGNPYQIKTTLRDGTFGIVIEDFQRAGLRFD